MKLQDKLNEFNKKQIAKFIEVERKHPDNSVTKDDSDFWKRKGGNDITQIHHADNLLSQLEYHMVEEVCEYFGLKDLANHMMYMINSELSRLPEDVRTPEYKAKECIDISNLSFLIWCLKQDE